ncbi:MAG: protein-L-isoaspartate(D-aspartate) O-methyltransferase [Betaproteobacteria bacterium]|nr:protein-L-isoaspartate(D-aspartate) O-methyltransferase [Betaproteobacteria bacterium]
MRCNPRLLLRDIATPIAATLALILGGAAYAQQDDIAAARRDLVVHIQQATAAIASQTGVASIDANVLEAFAKVPRHRFVPGLFASYAYQDVPLPLGHEQNLTQPSLLALMTQVLAIKPGQKVFETGTDTGYQAAILAELKAEVFSMEIVQPLLQIARMLLPLLGYKGISLVQGDGASGWAEKAPFDAIMVKESAPEIPPALWQQLKPGGRMVIPLGPAQGPQVLTLLTKRLDGSIERRPLLPVRFAPFQGGERT